MADDDWDNDDFEVALPAHGMASEVAVAWDDEEVRVMCFVRAYGTPGRLTRKVVPTHYRSSSRLPLRLNMAVPQSYQKTRPTSLRANMLQPGHRQSKVHWRYVILFQY